MGGAFAIHRGAGGFDVLLESYFVPPPGNDAANGRHDLDYLDAVNTETPEYGDLHDELPLWSAPFGLLLLDRVPILPCGTYLDVGAGTGFVTLELAQRCGVRSTIVAVDPWEAAIRRLRRKVAHLGVTHVELLERDASSTGLPDESIDVIVSNLGINNFENAAAVLGECYRVARRDAALLLTTNLKGHMAELYDAFRESLIEIGREDRIAALDAHEAHRGSVESVGAILESAGFEVLDVAGETFRMRFANASALLWHHLMRLGFIPPLRTVASEESLQQTFETLERRLDAIAAACGEIVLTIPVACFEARKP